LTALIRFSRFESILADMRKSLALLAPLLLCSLAFGQLDSNSITVTAANNAALQADQAVFSVSVQSPLTIGFDDVLAALSGSGITAANFSSVTTQNDFSVLGAPGTQVPPPMLAWTFVLTAPLTNTKATVASLTTVQQNIAKAGNGLTLSFNIQGTQVSQQLAQSQTCSIPSLLTAATTQAQALASSAGNLTLGTILAMSSSTSNVAAGPPNPYSVSAAPPPCQITVKFNVTRH
jgi:hypothetical protein